MDRRTFIKTGSAAAAAAFGGCATAAGGAKKLAILGGTPVVDKATAEADFARCFTWPIVNDAMRKASDDVLVKCKMSGRDIAIEFEKKFAAWNGTKYAVSCLNGTTALNTAFYAIGIGPGDEVICPSITMWASCMGVVNLGGTVVFCDVREKDLTVDPASFEAHITPRTKAIVVVHYMGSPCDMDPIMAIAKKHGLKVIEDVSHAQGGLYKGRKLGSIGDIGAMSLMSGKSFAIGEAGMMVMNDPVYYEKSIRWGMYGRMNGLTPAAIFDRTFDVPFGGIKNRLNQCTAAVGLEQLKKYDAERADIEKAELYYHEQIKDIPWMSILYPEWTNSNKAGWYATRCHYHPERAMGLDNRVIAEALSAECPGFGGAGCNWPLHWSSIFNDEDILGNGQPPSKRYLPAGVTSRSLTGTLPVSDRINGLVLGDPWFKRFDKPIIDRFVEAAHKVNDNLEQLRGLEPKRKGYSYWPKAFSKPA